MQLYEKYIYKIIQDRDLDVNPITLKRYYHYLVKNLRLPCVVKHTEGNYFDFTDYGKDTPDASLSFELLEVVDEVQDYSNLFCKVRPVGSEKVYEFQLFEFETADAHNGPILELSSMWIDENL